MEGETFAILLATGLAGGLITALVGGATLVTFPIMVLVGIPPVAAIASNIVALAPANLMAAFADRRKLPPLTPAALWLMGGCLVAGGAGAALLLATPERWFEGLVPALIGFATLLFAFADPIKRAVAARREGRVGNLASVVAPATLLSIYGGYFGAGMGILYLALLSLGGVSDLRAANAMKNLLGAANSTAVIAIFIVMDSVLWPVSATMLAGALIGGYGGGYAMRFLPAVAFKRGVVAVGAVMTAVYAWRYWF
jgi:uncharacterized protein